MDNVKRIIEDVKREKNRTDKVLTHIEFEIRIEQVIMFFNYDDLASSNQQDHYFVKHNHDPEFIDMNMLNDIKSALKEMHMPFSERRDDFL